MPSCFGVILELQETKIRICVLRGQQQREDFRERLPPMPIEGSKLSQAIIVTIKNDQDSAQTPRVFSASYLKAERAQSELVLSFSDGFFNGFFCNSFGLEVAVPIESNLKALF